MADTRNEQPNRTVAGSTSKAANPAFIITPPGSARLTPFPSLRGASVTGKHISFDLLSQPGRPVRAWLHELESGTILAWTQPPVGHAIYLLEGEMDAFSGDQTATRVGADGALLVEHGGTIMLRAVGKIKFLHFYRDESLGEVTSRPGGQAHILGIDGIGCFNTAEGPPRYNTLYADSACERCELWLHRGHGWAPGRGTSVHYHTVDEVIYVLEGSMLFGKNELEAGSVVAIDAMTAYKFSAGPRGLALLNFRPAEPEFVAVTRDGKPPIRRIERDIIRAHSARQE